MKKFIACMALAGMLGCSPPTVTGLDTMNVSAVAKSIVAVFMIAAFRNRTKENNNKSVLEGHRLPVLYEWQAAFREPGESRVYQVGS